MILVDTSIWIDHLRAGNQKLERLLLDGEVAGHPLITGELACGNLANRAQILDLMTQLPQAATVDDEHLLTFIERRNLMGQGIGYVDVSLLASALLENYSLWTADLKLRHAAGNLKLAY